MNDSIDKGTTFGVQEIVNDYFPSIEGVQRDQLAQLEGLYTYWNARINVISRRDIGNLYLHHVLHSLALAKICSLRAGADVLDLGTGGGFPGIPLAILYPKTHFYLVDSTAKKVKVVEQVCAGLGLTNVTPLCQRVETLEGKYDFVLSRAVASMSRLYAWAGDKVKGRCMHALPNGLFCWKGGDVGSETKGLPLSCTLYPLKAWFSPPYFQDKVIVHAFDARLEKKKNKR